MSQSGREVEVKLAFASPEQALRRIERLGARRVAERVFEDNVLYERDVDPLKPQDKLSSTRHRSRTAGSWSASSTGSGCGRPGVTRSTARSSNWRGSSSVSTRLP
jgi:hypothetical protein